MAFVRRYHAVLSLFFLWHISELSPLHVQVFTLGRLSALGAAQLFARRLPRTLSKHELFDGLICDSTQKDRRVAALEALASHPVMSYLAGHPQAISLATPLLQVTEAE